MPDQPAFAISDVLGRDPFALLQKLLPQFPGGFEQELTLGLIVGVTFISKLEHQPRCMAEMPNRAIDQLLQHRLDILWRVPSDIE